MKHMTNRKAWYIIETKNWEFAFWFAPIIPMIIINDMVHKAIRKWKAKKLHKGAKLPPFMKKFSKKT